MGDLEKQATIDFYKKINLEELINNSYERLDFDFSGIITSINFPIHYLFDHVINNSLMSAYRSKHYLIQTLELNTLFSLDTKAIKYISTDSHATNLYKFEYNNRKYIYYSNSGLGINNQICKQDMTSCIILYFYNNDELWNKFNDCIEEIINFSNTINYSDTIPFNEPLSRVDKIWFYIQYSQSLIIDRDEYNMIIQYMIKEDIKCKGQYLCYALLYYMCNKHNKDKNPNSYIENCTINHVLCGHDNIKYTDRMKELIGFKTLKDLLDNSFGKPYLNFNNIAEIAEEDTTNNQVIIDFQLFINNINLELNKLDSTTIRYKLQHSFKLFHSNISGLYNNIQQSGSCTFYSYYNLALNMKILDVFKNKKNVQEVIDTFVTFHNRMIYLFCLSNDTRYLPTKNGKFVKENLYNLQYIHKLIKDAELLDELINIYPHTTFLLHSNKLLIDQLLNFKLDGSFIINNQVCREINHVDIFNDWYDYLNNIMYEFRNKNDVNIKSVIEDIKTIFKQIIHKIETTDNMLKYLIDIEQLPYQSYTFKDLYFNTICEIWIIYLIFLYEMYRENDIDGPKEKWESENYFYLDYYVPSLLLPKEKWDRFDYILYNEKIENKLTNYKIISFNSNIIDLYLNFNEIFNISDKIKEQHFLNRIKIHYSINFEYTNFITICGNRNRGFTHYKEAIHFNNPIQKLNILKIYHSTFNKNIDSSINDAHRITLENYKNVFKKYLNEDNNLGIFNANSSPSYLFDITLNIWVLTNFNLLLIHQDNFINYLNNPNYTLFFSLIRNIKAKILIVKFNMNLEKIYTYLCDSDDNIDTKIENVISIINTINSKKEDWIEKCGFIVPVTDKIDEPVIYNDKQYLSLTYYDENNINDMKYVSNNNITFLLYRFGLDFRDIHEYIFLYPIAGMKERPITSSEKENTNTIYDIIPNKEKCFILIKKYKKCIEITFNDDPNNSIDINNCYIFDETNKDKKNKLLFNLSKQTHPFISIIPENSPYLCYEKDNHFYLEFILSSSISKNSKGSISELYKKNQINYNFKLSMYTIKIAPSCIFPTINTYNSDLHNLLLDFYETPRLTLTSKNNIIKDKYKIQDSLRDLNHINHELYRHICDTISCNSPIDMRQFECVLSEIQERPDRIRIIDSFYNEHRIAPTVNCEHVCINDIHRNLPILTRIKSVLISQIRVEKKTDDFIVNNIHIWLLVMEVNILINLINHFIRDKTNQKLKSGDIQDKLTTLQSIQYFNDKIKTDFYYGVELLFLLQNEYFFKESQMTKYNVIRQELLKHEQPDANQSLTCHQFMMGKGKTSVFTPLLSFVIKLVKDKQPTIITMEHLIKPTRKYTIFIEDIMNIKVNILSDFHAKKRWLEHTDKNLLVQQKTADLISAVGTNLPIENEMKEQIGEIKSDLHNEMNLIDEFDSHHNYLQSMFNVVNKKMDISIDLFTYIFTFTYNKNKALPFVPYKIQANDIIQNVELLYENLEKFYNQSETMIYNKDYGFAFTIEKDYYHQSRICTPFARKDTPVKNSNFSSLLLTLILTFKEYINKYGCKLNHDILYDYNNIILNNQLLRDIINISEISKEKKILFYSILCQDNLNLNSIDNILKAIYETPITNEIKNRILIYYLYNVNNNQISITTQQFNMSFQDIIYNNYEQWQVGYTGTASLKLNDYEPHETNVFRKIIKDPDEIIEIKLALNGYAYTGNYTKTVSHINKIDTRKNINININIIIDLVIDNPRGFVDLAGIFLDLENKEVARLVQLQLAHKNIVYFEDDHEAYQYNDSHKIKYTESHPDNFYYYDQCHTVGSDLKQPFDGHVAIIINRNTRYTDFAQAVFRFRKINRGTCVSVVFVIDDKVLPITNDEIYDLLLENETKFNNEQQDGLKYQLLKAMIRKETKNYQEIDLKPEFMLLEQFNLSSIKLYMNNNIVNIQSPNTLEQTLDQNSFIKQLYDNILKLDLSKLTKLIVGSGNEIQKQQQQQVDEQQQQQVQEEQEQQKIKLNYNQLSWIGLMDKMYNVVVIEHLNCSLCDKQNCIKLFNSLDIKINKKDIYISFNLISEINNVPTSVYNQTTKLDLLLFSKLHTFIYVEFNNKILIESESYGIDYYINKLPVYNFEGTLIAPHMYNGLNEHNLKKLDIDYRFIKMIGIKNYKNPIHLKQPIYIDIQPVVNDLTPYGFLILAFYLLSCTDENRYNISNELKNKINDIFLLQRFNSPDFKISFTEADTHNIKPEDNLTNVYFNMYNSNLNLDSNGYVGIPNKIGYKTVYYMPYLKSERTRDLLSMHKYTLKTSIDVVSFDERPFEWPKGYIFRETDDMTRQQIIDELSIFNQPYDTKKNIQDLRQYLYYFRESLPDVINPRILISNALYQKGRLLGLTALGVTIGQDKQPSLACIDCVEPTTDDAAVEPVISPMSMTRDALIEELTRREVDFDKDATQQTLAKQLNMFLNSYDGGGSVYNNNSCLKTNKINIDELLYKKYLKYKKKYLNYKKKYVELTSNLQN